MDETEELIELCVRSLAAQMIGGPGIELHMTRRCILGLTDEPLADFNRLTLGDDPDAQGFLIRAAARAKERGRPLSAVMSPQASQALALVATRLGFTAVGTSPLMVLRPGVAVELGRPIAIVRALGPELVGAAGDLIAAAFDTPRDVIARCIDVCVTAAAGVETWGMGRALLTRVIADYRRRGVERFHLGSSEAGRRLYASLGFELVADLRVWVLGRPV
jgi:hypothetical protein